MTELEVPYDRTMGPAYEEIPLHVIIIPNVYIATKIVPAYADLCRSVAQAACDRSLKSPLFTYTFNLLSKNNWMNFNFIEACKQASDYLLTLTETSGDKDLRSLNYPTAINVVDHYAANLAATIPELAAVLTPEELDQHNRLLLDSRKFWQIIANYRDKHAQAPREDTVYIPYNSETKVYGDAQSVFCDDEISMRYETLPNRELPNVDESFDMTTDYDDTENYGLPWIDGGHDSVQAHDEYQAEQDALNEQGARERAKERRLIDDLKYEAHGTTRELEQQARVFGEAGKQRALRESRIKRAQMTEERAHRANRKRPAEPLPSADTNRVVQPQWITPQEMMEKNMNRDTRPAHALTYAEQQQQRQAGYPLQSNYPQQQQPYLQQQPYPPQQSQPGYPPQGQARPGQPYPPQPYPPQPGYPPQGQARPGQPYPPQPYPAQPGYAPQGQPMDPRMQQYPQQGQPRPGQPYSPQQPYPAQPGYAPQGQPMDPRMQQYPTQYPPQYQSGYPQPYVDPNGNNQGSTFATGGQGNRSYGSGVPERSLMQNMAEERYAKPSSPVQRQPDPYRTAPVTQSPEPAVEYSSEFSEPMSDKPTVAVKNPALIVLKRRLRPEGGSDMERSQHKLTFAKGAYELDAQSRMETFTEEVLDFTTKPANPKASLDGSAPAPIDVNVSPDFLFEPDMDTAVRSAEVERLTTRKAASDKTKPFTSFSVLANPIIARGDVNKHFDIVRSSKNFDELTSALTMLFAGNVIGSSAVTPLVVRPCMIFNASLTKLTNEFLSENLSTGVSIDDFSSDILELKEYLVTELGYEYGLAYDLFEQSIMDGLSIELDATSVKDMEESLALPKGMHGVYLPTVVSITSCGLTMAELGLKHKAEVQEISPEDASVLYQVISSPENMKLSMGKLTTSDVLVTGDGVRFKIFKDEVNKSKYYLQLSR